MAAVADAPAHCVINNIDSSSLATSTAGCMLCSVFRKIDRVFCGLQKTIDSRRTMCCMRYIFPLTNAAIINQHKTTTTQPIIIIIIFYYQKFITTIITSLYEGM